jgi:hypothetical protein
MMCCQKNMAGSTLLPTSSARHAVMGGLADTCRQVTALGYGAITQRQHKNTHDPPAPAGSAPPRLYMAVCTAPSDHAACWV